MGTEFTVITTDHCHFGDHKDIFSKESPGANFMRKSGTFEFETPGADAGSPALLMFETYAINFRHNIMEINGGSPAVSGGLTPSVEKQWQSHVAVIPAGKLNASGANTLLIESRTVSGEEDGNLDDFMVANVVVLYKS